MKVSLGNELRDMVSRYLHGTPNGDRLTTLSYYADALEADLLLTRRLQAETAGRADENSEDADELFEELARMRNALNEALELLGEEDEAGLETEPGFLSEYRGVREW